MPPGPLAPVIAAAHRPSALAATRDPGCRSHLTDGPLFVEGNSKNANGLEGEEDSEYGGRAQGEAWAGGVDTRSLVSSSCASTFTPEVPVFRLQTVGSSPNSLTDDPLKVQESQELVDLLDSRLLWIASAPPIGASWWTAVGEGVEWMTSPELWLEAGGGALRTLGKKPFLSGLYAIVLVGLVLARRRLKGKLPELALNIGKYASDSFATTLGALVVTLLLALPAPVGLAGAGALLLASSSGGLAVALGHGFVAAAAVYLLLGFFLQMCRHGGLAEAHFGWNTRARQTLFVNLRWLLLVEVLAAFVVAATDGGKVELYRQGLGRLAFMLGAIGVTVFVARVFGPDRGVFSELMSRNGWAWRMRRLWHGALVLLPAFLVVAAAAGYYFTASEVQSRFFITGLVVLTGIVTYSILKRWLLVARHRLAVKQAREKLAQQREARQQADAVEDGEAAASGEAVPELELQTIDVTAASAQTLALLRTVVTAVVFAWLWGVWREVLPALSILERVNVTAPALDATGAVLVPAVTAWALLLAALTAVLTFVAARNLPAVLELAVLQRFELDHGARYAAATLTRYLVVTVGVVFVSKLVGVDWSRAQWIIAALGVGLGFGLQEIVANFVSGIIILFERPIRVGDTVTVGEDSGTVTRLRIRATTITDWDNKEILVPNKSFITDRVVNWTLSDPVTRLLLRVGVAYGTDEALAQKTIAEAVKSVSAVLEEPGFSVLFVGFGESSLDFEVRVFVSELSKRLPTLHALNSAINGALSRAGIEIPFPQRDLHLRTSDVGPVPAPTTGPGEQEPER